MEMEPTKPLVVAKKLWKIIDIVFIMIKAGISKSKIMVDLNLLLKRGNKIAGKAIVNLLFHHHRSSFSCRSNDVHLSSSSFISPKEYEFSCSNSPAFNYPFKINHSQKRRHHHLIHKAAAKSCHYDDVATVQAMKRVLEMLNNNNNDHAVEEAPSPLTTLPGFGRSPFVRQLRVTDSPFPLKDEGDTQVDKAAEEFIKKFYKDLELQKSMAALESPFHDSWGR